MAAWQWRHQRGGRRGGGSAAAVAVVVVVAAIAWWRRQPAWRRMRQLGRSATLDAVAALQEARRQRGGSNGSAAAVAAALRWQAAWQRRWQFGGSSLAAAAWRQPSCGDGSGSAAAASAAGISSREEKSSVQGKYCLNNCGDGQTSDVQTTLEEYLSHSAWKGTGTTMGIAAVV